MVRPMEIDFGDIFSDEDMRELAEVLGIGEEEDRVLEESLARIVRASVLEYRDMLLEGGLSSRANEIRERRLFFLITTYFEGSIPTEPQVSQIFHENLSTCKTMIRNVLTRYARELEDSLESTLRRLLDTAERDSEGDAWKVVIQSDNALERINRIIASEAPTLDPVRKVRNSARVYRIEPDSYEVLRAALAAENEDAT